MRDAEYSVSFLAVRGVICLVVAGSVGMGCAASRSQSREEQPVLQPVAAPSPAVPPPAEPTLVVTKKKKARKKGQDGAQVHRTPAVNAVMKRFVATRPMQGARKKKQDYMPPEVEERWRTVLDEVEVAAAADGEEGAEGQQLSALMRARMILETEYQLDKRRYREVPQDLTAQWRETLGLVDERVRLLRDVAEGFALGEQFENDGSLVLHFPMQVVSVTSYFGQRRDPILRKQTRFHSGVDLAGSQGSLVQAAGPGVVVYADWQGAGGNHVVVLHPRGYRTHYSHLSKILVTPGSAVEEGTPLGLVGDTGRSTGPHLHFSVSRHGAFVDPLDVMDVPLTRDGPSTPRS